MNTWEKKISKDPHNDFLNIVQYYSKEEKLNIISGLNPSYTNQWTPLQCLLFWGPDKYKSLLFHLLEEGANPNVYSKRGLNFYHLFLCLLFYQKNFQTKEIFDIFLKTLKFGFQPNFLVILSFQKIYLPLDFFLLLSKGQVKNISFLKNNFHPIQSFVFTEMKNLYFYNSILFSFFCYNSLRPQQELPDIACITLRDIYYYLKYDILKAYLVNIFKLPFDLSNDEIVKRIFYLSKKEKHLPLIFENENHVDIPFNVNERFRNSDNDSVLFINPELVGNNFLSKDEYLPVLVEGQKKYYFHETYYPILIRQKTNPYSRQPISSPNLQSWKEHLENKFVFPIQTTSEFLKTNDTYIFSFKTMTDYIKYRQCYAYIEQLFQFYHPYNQINKVLQQKNYELQYFAHVLVYESNLMKNFKQVLKKPNYITFFKNLLFYCRKGTKFINMIYFFSEEIFQDLQCYEKIENNIDNLDENTSELWDQYYSRYSTFHPSFMKKFLQQLLLIQKYKTAV